jgi:thiamine biosynthesis lipoprotein
MTSSWRFDAIGTTWSIESDAAVAPQVRARIMALIDAFDQEWSRFRIDSQVAALAPGGSIPAPADAEPMLSMYAEVSEATRGAVNPLVGGSLERLGYDRGYTLRARSPQPAPDWRAVLHWRDGVLGLDQPAVIDVGALGKGRLVDLVLGALTRSMTGGIVVDAGGDVAVRGMPQRIALEHPFDPTRAVGVVELTQGALCASAVNRRAWGAGLHHVLDARTGVPVDAIAATWAQADTAMQADAAATALFFDGGPELAHRWRVPWVRMLTDGRVQWSPGNEAELFV